MSSTHVFVPGGIDVRVRRTPEPLVLAGQIEEPAVSTEKHVGRERLECLDAPREVFGNLRIVLVVHQSCALLKTAARNQHVVRPPAVRDSHRPRGAALRVAGSQVCRERGASQRNLFTIFEHTVDRMRLSARRLHGLERGHILFHCHDRRTTSQFLEDGVGLLVIGMGVAAKNDLDVSQREPEFLD